MHIYTPIKGLGTTISMLSLLDHHFREYTLHCTNENTDLVADLVNYFELPVEVYHSPGAESNAEFSDHGKFFVPYIQKNIITGNQIGLSWVADLRDLEYIGSTNDYPYCKYHSVELKHKLETQYNTIDLDQPVSLKEKIELLMQCQAIISYDGGIAHLAHCLGIPVILLPWHHNANGGNNTDWCSLYVESLHMDSQTCFVKDFDNINIDTLAGTCNNRILDAEQTVYSQESIRILHQQKWHSFRHLFTDFEQFLLHD